MAPPAIYFYHDGRHPLIYMYEPPITVPQYQAAVDELLGTPVDVLAWNLGDGRSMLHDTKVGERWGDNVEAGTHAGTSDGWKHTIFRRAHQNMAQLVGDGADPLRAICDKCHSRGLQLYPVLMMNQLAAEDDMRCSTWRLGARRLEIGAGGPLPPGYPDWAAGCLDYAREEVVAERLALIQEVCSDYPVDGLELNLRSGADHQLSAHFFRPEGVAAGAALLTALVAEARRLLRRGGAGRTLVVRVPGLAHCTAQGMEVARWCREGLVGLASSATLREGHTHSP